LWFRDSFVATNYFPVNGGFRSEMEHVVDAGGMSYVHEEGHSEDGVDEHDEKQQQADVEQCRQQEM